MKFFLNLIILFISLISFGQKKEYKHAKILYKDKLFIESNAILDKILNKEYGVLYKDDSRENINLQGLFEMDCWELKKDCLLKIRDYQAAYTSAEKYNELFRKFVGSSEGFNELASNELKKIESLIKNAENQESVSVENVKSNNSQIDGIIDNNIEKTNNPASSDKTVTLTVSGTGKTLEGAKLNALRSAIEQAFGAFISSKTEILNDNLVRDEIASVANGNIKEYKIISEKQLLDSSYLSSLNVIVSIGKLTTFCKNKGVVIEFQGGLFAQNIAIQMLNEENEKIAISNLCTIIKDIENKSFDYSIETKSKNPILVNSNSNEWKIPIFVTAKINKNFTLIPDLLFQNLKSLTLSKSEAYSYRELGKEIYPICFAKSKNEYEYFILRSKSSIDLLIDIIYHFNNSLINFKIENNVYSKTIEEFNQSSFKKGDEFIELVINDDNFRPIMKIRNNGSDYNALKPVSLFHNYTGSRFDSSKPNFNYKEVYSSQPNYLTTLNGKTEYFNNNFSYVLNLTNKMIENKSGLLISFLGINLNDIACTFSFSDKLKLEDIKKITDYKIIPKE
jgi:hypothetical protein